MLKKYKDSIINFLKTLPLGVWVVAALLSIFILWSYSSDIGEWWSKKLSEKAEKIDAQYQKKIEDLEKEKQELLSRALAAESREQTRELEAELLKQEAARRGVDVSRAEQRIEAALKTYEEDSAFIEAVKNGSVSKHSLCIKQCEDSAKIGYRCRPDYCDRFK